MTGPLHECLHVHDKSPSSISFLEPFGMMPPDTLSMHEGSGWARTNTDLRPKIARQPLLLGPMYMEQAG